MSRPKLLDLFCKAGGAGMGYHLAGFDVVGVDIEPQPRYPFEFHQADALSILRTMVDYPSFSGQMWRPGYFDAVHASPPCPAYSALASMPGVGEHPRLVEPVRELLNAVGLPYVMENVPGAPMPGALVLCGTEFGLGVRTSDGKFRALKRHRLFESNVFLRGAGGCHCRGHLIGGVYGHGGGAQKAGRRGWQLSASDAAQALDIDWMNRDELANAIPPAYTRFIGEQLLEALDRSEVAA